MFGLGLWEIGIILIVALLLLGPRRLPDLARSLGRGLQEFRQAIREDRGLD
jgi:TatA/E family protein of Tat protein translocase